MPDKKYRLNYLPLFYEELDDTIYYVVIDDDPDNLIMELRRFGGHWQRD